MWARRPELAAAINSEHRNPDYFPDGRAARLAARGVAIRRRRWPARISSCWPCRRSRSRGNLATWAIPSDAVVVSLAKGIELGTGLRMSEVIARGRRRSRRSGSPWSPGPTWPGRSRSASRRPAWWPAPILGTADRPAGHLPHGPVPGLHQRRRDRLRAGRRDQERDRPRGRDGDRSRPRRERDRVGDHPRPGRGDPARRRAGRGPVHVLGVWPDSATWSPPVPRRCRGTAPSARSSVGAVPSPRSPRRPGRSPRA